MKHFKSAAALVAVASVGSAIELDINNEDSIISAAGQVAKGLYTYHDPAATTGCFTQPEPWFWWLSGKAWTGLLDYMVYTNDTTYKADWLSCMQVNIGDDYNFLPASQASWEANDDMMYWVFNSLTAMEYEFEALDCVAAEDGSCLNSWLAISVNAFDFFVQRWEADHDTCNGGLKWQFNQDAAGWNYKNSVTNGGFLQVAARLARYTGEQKYADWAAKIWDWTASVGLVNDDTYAIADGTSDLNSDNCAPSTLEPTEWTYNMATFMIGAANMYAYYGPNGPVPTKNKAGTWERRVQGLLTHAEKRFFGPPVEGKNGIMYEQHCEPDGSCTTDSTSFKSSLARWMGKTAVLVPSVQGKIMSLLESTAAGAAGSCAGQGEEGTTSCGVKWYTGGFDGQADFGTQLSALEAIGNLLVLKGPEFSNTWN